MPAFVNIHIFALLAKLINVDMPSNVKSDISIFNDYLK